MTPFLVCAKYGGWAECNDYVYAWSHDTPRGSMHLAFEIDPTLVWENGPGGCSGDDGLFVLE